MRVVYAFVFSRRTKERGEREKKKKQGLFGDSSVVVMSCGSVLLSCSNVRIRSKLPG